MALNKSDERYMVIEEIGGDQNEVVLTESEMVENTLFLIDGRNYRLIRNDVTDLALEKAEDKTKFHGREESQKNIVSIEKIITPNSCLPLVQLGCAVCQNACTSCKYLCVTCKAPCRSCIIRPFSCASTDTDDFDKYLDSLTKKVKVQPKARTTGTDTCDLESHFDYYKEKKPAVIQKSVGTDCEDLASRKPPAKKPVKKTVGVDTIDLVDVNSVKKEALDESDCEFAWNLETEPKTYSKKSILNEKSDLGIVNEEIEKSEEDEFEEKDINGVSDVSDENLSEDEVAVKSEDKENFDGANKKKQTRKIRTISFDDSSTSGESDLDLVTSSKLAKSKKVAKSHKLTLDEVKTKEETVFECGVCKEGFQKKYLAILHLESHVESNEYSCVKCEKKFSSLNLLSAHVKKEHLKTEDGFKNEKNIKCDICDKKFTSKSNMLSHKRFHKRKDKSFECNLCEESSKFSSYKALYVHKRLKHGILNSQTTEEEKRERKPRVKREFVCLFCGKEFKSNKALSDHSPVHTGEKNYLCDICNKSYTTSANLQIHKRTHTGQKNFKCTACDKAFHKKDSLKVHFRKHSGERPFQCDLCPMKFDRNYILKNHRLRHFSEKTYICPVCGKAFTTHGGLSNHEKSHKRESELKKPRKPAVKPTLDTENAVICDVCGKVYSTRSNLRIHKFVHLGVKPFQCPVCQQSYAKKDSMLTHMRKHTDERPFACETCGMTFYRNHTLKTHRLRHTGERPHKCNMCGKSFTQSSSLAYHVKNHERREGSKKLTEEAKNHRKKRLGQTKNIPLGIKKTKQVKLPRISEDQTKKNPEEILVIKEDNNENFGAPDKEVSFSRGGHFMVPVVDKEVLILDRDLSLESSSHKEIDFFNLDKDIPCANNKLNYFITKSHVFSVPKENKTIYKSVKNEESENLIVSKNSYITKDGNLVTTNRMKKEEFGEAREKLQGSVQVEGEILNPAFITDEHGDMIPFNTMTLQSINADNIMINPIISAEPEELDKRKASPKTHKLTKVNAAAFKPGFDKNLKHCHVMNLKDARTAQRIQVISPAPLHIQVPISTNSSVEDVILHGIAGGYYQSNQL